MVAKVNPTHMNGLTLIAGVMSACISLVLLAGGLVMLFLSLFVARGDDKRFNDGARATSFFVVAGCGYLGLSLLCGIWVRPESWIVVGCISIVGVFLATLTTWLERDDDNEEVQNEKVPKV